VTPGDQTPPEKKKKWPWVVGGVVALFIVAAVAGGGGEDADDTVSTATTEETTAPSTDETPETTAPSDDETPETTAPPTTTAPTTTAAPTTTTPPRPSFGEGTQLVGTDVQPGIYISEGSGGCYWQRLSGVSGDFDDILANGNSNDQVVIEIAASDTAFDSSNCARWTLYSAPPAPAATFGDGDWVVNEQIEAGRYRSDGGDGGCYWERASGLQHGFDDILANDNASGQAIVEISPSDRRFSSSGCGTWTKV
jgi:hypothetical protein